MKRHVRFAATASLLVAFGAGTANADEAETATQTQAAPSDGPQWQVSVFGGIAIPNDGLEYGVGSGVSAGLTLNKIYLAATLGAYVGDEKSIDYGPVSSLGIEGGEQKYSSTPILLAVDAGYDFRLFGTTRALTLRPYLSTGVMLISLGTSGVYGDSSSAEPRFLIGGGASLHLAVSDHVSVGIQYRMYQLGDDEFELNGNESDKVPHGFSTTLFYGAFSAELTYRF